MFGGGSSSSRPNKEQESTMSSMPMTASVRNDGSKGGGTTDEWTWDREAEALSREDSVEVSVCICSICLS